GGKRRRQDDEIGAGDRGGGIVGDRVGKAEALDRRQRLGPAGAGDERGLRALAAQHPGERRADQADADKGDAGEGGSAHRRAMNSPSTAATFSISSPVPMVIL